MQKGLLEVVEGVTLVPLFGHPLEVVILVLEAVPALSLATKFQDLLP
jgi:hypothetical protein